MNIARWWCKVHGHRWTPWRTSGFAVGARYRFIRWCRRCDKKDFHVGKHHPDLETKG